MSATEEGTTGREASLGRVDMKLELQIIPVSDVDRAKQFYEQLGWRFDRDVAPMESLRVVQFTPPGSPASITFGKGLTTAAPGAAERSCLRELIPSLPNVLVRCHSTVRGLRNSWAPISGFVCPSAARRATCTS